ncbi:MAG: LLM class flavin-dependent oxidoreductase [Chloroflexi bacterium]|nr:LLM class flavin-dependent oxidoreductase [Chloroflexota bacterium]
MARYGVRLENDPTLTPQDYQELGAQAERNGFEAVWVPEGGGRDSLTSLATIAMKTDTVKLGTGILPIFARTATNKDIQLGAISLLADIKDSKSLEFIHDLLESKDSNVVSEAIRLIRRVGDEKYVDLLKPHWENERFQVQENAIKTKLSFLLPSQPKKAINFLLKIGEDLPTDYQKKLSSKAQGIPKVLINQVLEEGKPVLRATIAEQLRVNRKLTIEICDKILQDSSLDVRVEGLLGLIELGEDLKRNQIDSLLPDSHPRFKEVLTGWLGNKKQSHLMDLLDWYSLDGPLAYQVLATKYFDIIEPRIRADLEDDFEKLRIESNKSLLEKYGESAKKITERDNRESLDNFMRTKYFQEALAGLEKNGVPTDVKYARKFFDSVTPALWDDAAINIIGKHGNKADVDTLLEIAHQEYGDKKAIAIQLATELISSPKGISDRMLTSDDPEILKSALLAIHRKFKSLDDKTMGIIKSLLYSTHDEVRFYALSVLLNNLTKVGAEKLLDEYPSVGEGMYYYNVVTWLDRYLYAPSPIQEYYADKIVNTE